MAALPWIGCRRDPPPGGRPSAPTEPQGVTPPPNPQGGRAADVLVIGAGISGLRAAEVLREAGKRVIVLEARDRLGGRVWTDRSWPGRPLDMGASWIQGVRDNPIAARAREAGIVTVATPGDLELHDPGGQNITGRAEAIVNRFQRLLRAARESIDDDEPLRACLDRALRAEELSERERLEMEFAITSVVEHEYAADAGELSGEHFDDGDGLDGGDAMFPGGYDQIVTAVARGTDARTGHVVRSIQWADEGVTVTTSRGVFQGRAAVITVPLGVLKAGSITFSPVLPHAKLRAIGRLGMGLLSKTWLRFPSVFWPVEHEYLDRIPPASERGQWAESVNLARLDRSPVLLGFNAGAYGRAVEAMSDEAAMAAAHRAYRSMFGPAALAPIATVRSHWSTDPYALGSYSYLAVGSSNDDRDALAAPAGALFFAGEACSRDHAATVHGAWRSGERAARALLRG